MLRYITLRYVMLRYVTLCYVIIQYNTIQSNNECNISAERNFTDCPAAFSEAYYACCQAASTAVICARLLSEQVTTTLWMPGGDALLDP